MQQSTANDFYERIVNGTDQKKTIELEHGSGAKLEGVKVSPVNKATLAATIQNLPEDLFEAVESAESPEEAEKMIEQQDNTMSISALGEDTVEAFEDLCSEALSHPELTSTQMDHIISELDFGLLFEIGGDVIDMSFADGGAIKDFREQE